MFVAQLASKYGRNNIMQAFHNDGSVDWDSRILASGNTVRSKLQNRYERDGVDSRYAEFSSPVLSSFKSTLGMLEMFTDDNYGWNYSCGMHFHIGSLKRSEYDKLRKQLADIKLLRALYVKAHADMCEHQTSRLDNAERKERYYRFWETDREVFNDQHRGYKYRFLNFGHRNTLEFRFFCPCMHKADNLLKFMTLLMSMLNEPTTEPISLSVQPMENSTKELRSTFEVHKHIQKVFRTNFNVRSIDNPREEHIVPYMVFAKSFNKYREFSKVIEKYYPKFSSLHKKHLSMRIADKKIWMKYMRPKGYISPGWVTMGRDMGKKVIPYGDLAYYIKSNGTENLVSFPSREWFIAPNPSGMTLRREEPYEPFVAQPFDSSRFYQIDRDVYQVEGLGIGAVAYGANIPVSTADIANTSGPLQLSDLLVHDSPITPTPTSSGLDT
ncbi:unnamed protein product, partial [Sphagnum balticum]